MLFIRYSLLVTLSILFCNNADAQVSTNRLFVPNTRLSLQAPPDLVRQKNSTELRSPDGRSWLSFVIFTDENLDLLHQSVLGTLPNGPRDTIWLLGGEAFVERMIDYRVAGGQTYRYAGSIQLKDGRYLGLTANVFADGIITATAMEQTLQSLRWEEELAPVFYNASFSFDPTVLPLQPCRERLAVHPIVFTLDGHCNAANLDTQAVMITSFGKRGLRGSAVVALLGDLYYRYDEGILKTTNGYWRRYVRPATDTEPFIILYHLQGNGEEVVVQATNPDDQITIFLLDQFVATFERQ